MATKRKALGKGLNALLPAAPTPAERNYLELPLDEIVPNKYQPRSIFEPAALNELAQSIKMNGVVQPIIVRRTGSQFQLITGERRLRAAKMAGLKTIPAVVKEVSEYKTLELALIENIQRQDLNPMEEAAAYSSLMEDFGLTQEEVAHRVGKDRSSVANYIRLLRLPPEVKEKIEAQELSMGHARALIGLEGPGEQIALANKIVEQEWSVRQIEDWIRKARSRPGKTKQPTRLIDANVKAAEQRLQEFLGTRVVIHPSGKTGGRVEIYFQNDEDLIRIYDLIAREK